MIYVDDMKANFIPAHAPGRTYVMSHMVADSDDELHAFAARLGLKRSWFQNDHYDITQTKRKLAVRWGAKEITIKEMARMVGERRRARAAAIA